MMIEDRHEIAKTMDESFVPDEVVDARGLICPLPVLKTRLAMTKMHSGQCLQVLATDPTSQDDMPIFAEQTGHTLIQNTVDGEVFIYGFRIK